MMQKSLSGLKRLGFLCLVILAMVGDAVAAPKISAVSAAVYDVTSGEWLYLKNADMAMQPASTVKLVTAMVILDRWQPDRTVTIPRSAEAVPPFKVHVKSGEKYTAGDLIYALLMRSGNDVAHALAVRFSGSEGKFREAMNRKTRALGARHSFFANPHGLPDNRHTTTARDLALITAGIRNYPFIEQVLGAKYRNFRRPSSGEVTQFESRNKLLLWNFSPRILGKTGFTNKAGRCFTGYTTDTRTPMVIVLLNAPQRWEDLQKLAKWSDSFYPYSIRKNRKWLNREQILGVQRALKAAGHYNGPIDGVFGTGTQAAVLKFQGARRLTLDGLVGSRTLTALGI